MEKEIMDYAKKNSDVTFKDICKKFKIKPVNERTLRKRFKDNNIELKDGRGRARIEF